MAGFFSNLFKMDNNTDFQTLLENGAILLDVRTKEEFKQGHAKNAINIPLNTLNSNLSKLKKDKPIITICQSGMRSRSAANLLKDSGYNNIYDGGSWFNFK